MLQGSEAALRAELAALRDDLGNGVPAGSAEAAEAGGGKSKSSWAANRIKEMKEKAAEKAKAKLHKAQHGAE